MQIKDLSRTQIFRHGDYWGIRLLGDDPKRYPVAIIYGVDMGEILFDPSPGIGVSPMEVDFFISNDCYARQLWWASGNHIVWWHDKDICRKDNTPYRDLKVGEFSISFQWGGGPMLKITNDIGVNFFSGAVVSNLRHDRLVTKIDAVFYDVK